MSRSPELVGPFPPGADPADYDVVRRRVLWSLPTGLYLLGSRAGKRRNMMTTSFVTQVATSPKLVALGIEEGSLTLELIKEDDRFALTLLRRSQRALVRAFVKPARHDEGERTLSGERYDDAPISGAPVLSSFLGYLDCRVHSLLDLGSHTLVVGEVLAVGLSSDAGASGRFEVLRVEDTRMSYGG